MPPVPNGKEAAALFLQLLAIVGHALFDGIATKDT